MSPLLTFFDLEVDLKTNAITDIGATRSDGADFHKNDLRDFLNFSGSSDFLVGHNIFLHDLNYIGKATGDAQWGRWKAIDTLLWSPLLFPGHPYHKLVKNDRFLPEDGNDPLEDSCKSRDLFYEEVAAFRRLDHQLRDIYQLLLQPMPGYRNFFRFLEVAPVNGALPDKIASYFHNRICAHAPLATLIHQNPVALAYALALVSSSSRVSITPPWVVHQVPEIESVIRMLCSEPCNQCSYCKEALAPVAALKRHFNFDAYRSFNGQSLQEEAVAAAMAHRSLLAVFPTGGGKSITFQVPALVSGETARALTVIISPLQSLMKDQVDNLRNRGITDAVTINGQLDPIERQVAIERVQGTSTDHAVAHLLYISPESLRSATIERMLAGRKIARFVIDEAHCFSTWGQDFRVDYLYIGDFIRNLQAMKGLKQPIPVSCFTATAKPQVITDICQYFKEKLGLDLLQFKAGVARNNLHYKVIPEMGDEEKYSELRSLLESRSCPTIVYVSRTRTAEIIAGKLETDGFRSAYYHGKMNPDQRVSSQDAFLAGNIDIMVATSAFGMGVDKDDVGRVIHYNISDSLENYVQEAGRAGRNENLSAECFVLFEEQDLDKHFELLNKTKLDVKEINQVWRAIKDLTKSRPDFSQSELEIARKAGWDENLRDLETRVKSAIAALEDAQFIVRRKNEPRVFANSILARNSQEAIDKIKRSVIIPEADKEKAIRIIKKLFSSKSKRLATEESAESRVDYISDQLGLHREQVIRVIKLLSEVKILADAKDLTAFVRKQTRQNRSLAIVDEFRLLEECLMQKVQDGESDYNLKEWNEFAQSNGCAEASPLRIRTLLNFWAEKNEISKKTSEHSRHHVHVSLKYGKAIWVEQIRRRHQLARPIVEFLFARAADQTMQTEGDEVLVDFSVLEMRDSIAHQGSLFGPAPTIDEIEDTLFYLSRIDAVKLEGGFLVVYNRMRIERLEPNNKVQYSSVNYARLKEHYENKRHQIHIVGAYARKMIEDYDAALAFVNNYFTLPQSEFLRLYFRNKGEELKRSMTPARFTKLFGQLSTAQMQIITDKENDRVVVAAGPGSGKTRVLVHKLASILLTEDVRYEQMLMLTFSRAAANEFKRRLVELIGYEAYYIDIKTFHSFCFDLLGTNGSLEKSDNIVQTAVAKIRAGEVERTRITKSVLVVDEAQDMNAAEYSLVQALADANDDLRIMLVGDDDQCIFDFRHSSPEFMKHFANSGAKQHELLINYRSRPQIVSFANAWIEQVEGRLKKLPVVADSRQDAIVSVYTYPERPMADALDDLRNDDFEGTTCLLAYKNEEAEVAAGYLRSLGIPAQTIQSHERIRLTQLRELRFFSESIQRKTEGPVVSEESWNSAKGEMIASFEKSKKLGWFNLVIASFEAVNPGRKYLSDWETFLSESRWEDFVEIKRDVVYTSTIHKAKGKEFDRVIVVLPHFKGTTDADKRLLYVAFTRAKKALSVHVTGDFLRFAKSMATCWQDRSAREALLSPLTLMAGYEDVYLDYFAGCQSAIGNLSNGDPLFVDGMTLRDSDGNAVLRFSKDYQSKLQKWMDRGYQFARAQVEFMAWWKGKHMEHEILILLPSLEWKLPG